MKCPTAINEVHIKSPIICFIEGNSPSRHIHRGFAFSRIQILILIPPLKIAGVLLVPFFFLRRHVLFLCHNYIIAEGQKLWGPLVKLTCYLLCFELEVIQKFVTMIAKFACPSTYLKNNVFFSTL